MEKRFKLGKTMFGDLWRLLKAKNGMLVQISWSKWLKEGDVNLKFFHRCVKRRFSPNALK